jgi:hypothetical protein
MMNECSFKPHINKKSHFEEVQPHYKKEAQIMENIKLDQKKKEIKKDLQKKYIYKTIFSMIGLKSMTK